MRSAILADNGHRTHVVVLSDGEEAVSSLNQFFARDSIRAGHLTAIGAFARVTLGWFDLDTRDYRRNEISEQVEVASFVGDVALRPDGVPALHVHCAVATCDGRMLGGHLLAADVHLTLEVVVEEVPAALQRHEDARSGLALLAIPAGDAPCSSETVGNG